MLPLFDKTLSRVSREHYITGKSSINFPLNDETGGWHFMNYYDKDSGVFKVSLSGIHFPETSSYLGDDGVIDVSAEMKRRGIDTSKSRIFMADHYRAAADMVIRWALSESKHCNVEVNDWFPKDEDQRKFFSYIDKARQKLEEVGKWKKVDCWKRSQLELASQGTENSM